MVFSLTLVGVPEKPVLDGSSQKKAKQAAKNYHLVLKIVFFRRRDSFGDPDSPLWLEAERPLQKNSDPRP